MRLLEVAGQPAFKIWMLSRPLRITAIVLGIVALLVLIWAIWTWRATPILTVGSVGLTIVTIVATMIVGPTLVGLVRYRQTLIQIGIGMGLLGWIVAWIHLRFFDLWYLRRGRID